MCDLMLTLGRNYAYIDTIDPCHLKYCFRVYQNCMFFILANSQHGDKVINITIGTNSMYPVSTTLQPNCRPFTLLDASVAKLTIQKWLK